MEFSSKVIGLPAVPETVNKIIERMFSSHNVGLSEYVKFGQEVYYGKPFVELQWRGLFIKTPRLISPVSGVILNRKKDSRDSHWCQILPYNENSYQLSGSQVFQELTKGIWPKKDSVYQYVSNIEDDEITDAISVINKNDCTYNDLTYDDIQDIQLLKEDVKKQIGSTILHKPFYGFNTYFEEKRANQITDALDRLCDTLKKAHNKLK